MRRREAFSRVLCDVFHVRAEGRLSSLDAVRARVWASGAEPVVRGEVWRLLLGLRAPHHTAAHALTATEQRWVGGGCDVGGIGRGYCGI
jgi:hypothetical protein